MSLRETVLRKKLQASEETILILHLKFHVVKRNFRCKRMHKLCLLSYEGKVYLPSEMVKDWSVSLPTCNDYIRNRNLFESTSVLTSVVRNFFPTIPTPFRGNVLEDNLKKWSGLINVKNASNIANIVAFQTNASSSQVLKYV